MSKIEKDVYEDAKGRENGGHSLCLAKQVNGNGHRDDVEGDQQPPQRDHPYTPKYRAELSDGRA